MKSKITGGKTDIIFTKRILNKYDISYYKCQKTGFIQTEEPYWLEEAYSSAITDEDTGICVRNEEIVRFTSKLFSTLFDTEGQYVDFGGGYGLYVRMMRDRGFNFYLYDKYSQNIFAKNYQIKKLGQLPQPATEAITAYEVFEHLTDPISTISELFNHTDTIVFSTLLVPNNFSENWWYLAPNHGQHISFYTEESLQYIASILKCRAYPNINKFFTCSDLGIQIHMLSRNNFKACNLNLYPSM